MRAANGTTIAVFAAFGPGERTYYRLYDRRWHPRTPLLEIDVTLEVPRSTATGFVGRASVSRRNGTYKLNKWVTINSHGDIHAVAHEPDRRSSPQPLRRGDIFLEGYRGTILAYRTPSDTVVRADGPSWATVGHSWYGGDDTDVGYICVLRSGRPIAEGAINTSINEGRTFTRIATANVLPPDSGPRLHSCWITRDRILVSTGGEYTRWIHTLDRTGRTLLSSQRLGGPLNPYELHTLPDGRLVGGTNRRGLMVATDSTNQTMDYRPGPVRRDYGVQVIRNRLVSVLPDGNLKISTDAGLTWQTVNLQVP